MTGRAFAISLVVLVAAAPSAAAQAELPRDNPAIDEYVPSVPAAPGDKPVGAGGQTAAPPPEVGQKLDQSKDRELLHKLASEDTTPPSPQQGVQPVDGGDLPVIQPYKTVSVPDALASSITGSGDPALLILLVGLLGGTIAAVAAARARRRS